ncbi:MAG: hypothetical protein IT170_18150 [Bryobacterales bacterium]|nr:hypothetical protein [Bryobacterales bacterium]
MPRLRCIFAFAFALLSATAVQARVVSVEITQRQTVAQGKRFGLAGIYEAIAGKLHFAVDPKDPANAAIADISLAPRNGAGEVEFAADFYFIRPQDLEKGNGAVLFEVSNRGGKGMLGFFSGAERSSAPLTAAQFGDGFLLERGLSLLWVGWQFDMPLEPGLLRVYVPVAKNADGSAITGPVRANIIVSGTAFSHSLADRGHIPYEAADPSDPRNVLTVRDTANGPARVIPRGEWSFARWDKGEAVPDRGSLYLNGGLQPNKVYDLVYVAKDPPVAGLGMAAVRDAVAYLKYGGDEAMGVKAGELARVYSFGSSQSGRFLRTFLYEGFNGDEKGRRVFDGVMAHVAGGGRGGFNLRFAQPSRDGHPFMNLLYPTDIYPFSDTVQRDPETGLEEGILGRYRGREGLIPKIFYTNSSYEYWGRAASLIHTTLDGTRDLAPAANTRIYHFAGTQHGTGSWPPARSVGQELVNPNRIRPAMRALLVAMDAWVRDGVAPPESHYGRIDEKTLVRPEDLHFPALPGRDLTAIRRSNTLEKAWRADYGPRFRTERIIDFEPPKLGKPFPTLVPQVDADGNEMDGIRLPDIAVPLATFTGWNLFNAKSGPTDVISSMVGGFIPFPRTKAEAERNADPRKPMDARYRSRDEYLGKVAEACAQLTKERLLLPEDLVGILEHAGEEWDWAMSAAR